MRLVESSAWVEERAEMASAGERVETPLAAERAAMPSAGETAETSSLAVREFVKASGGQQQQ